MVAESTRCQSLSKAKGVFPETLNYSLNKRNISQKICHKGKLTLITLMTTEGQTSIISSSLISCDFFVTSVPNTQPFTPRVIISLEVKMQLTVSHRAVTVDMWTDD